MNLQSILEYIYLGETAVPVDGTNAFLLAAKSLGVKDCIGRPHFKNDDANLSNNESFNTRFN